MSNLVVIFAVDFVLKDLQDLRHTLFNDNNAVRQEIQKSVGNWEGIKSFW